jgi:NAD(P)-dependent dehydrogenase (short-subunit alcohol dehydrogenase family)
VESFKGKVAVVTGGGSGIGRALVLALAHEGARVVIADLDEAAMDVVGRQVRAQGAEALTVRTDVTELGQVQALAERVFKTFGAVHVLCNNAGVAAWGGLERATHRDWQWVLGVNLWGVIHGVEAFVPRMIAAGEPGHIVNTASMAGLIASQGLGVYNTSKYAVVGLSETLAKDLKPYRIGVSVLCPMGVETRIRESERSRPAALRNEPGAEAAARPWPAWCSTPSAAASCTSSPTTRASSRSVAASSACSNRCWPVGRRQAHPDHRSGLHPLGPRARRPGARRARAVLRAGDRARHRGRQPAPLS